MTTKTAAPKTSSIYKAGNLYQVPPGTLVLERNIRAAIPDAELLASVKSLGVLQPITAVINTDGQLVVRLGHRRTLAAVEAGIKTVPVYVVDVEELTNDAEISRVIAQHDENTLRAGLTAGDELGVVEELTLLGLTADEIVGQARLGKDQVDTALRVSKSTLATKATAKYSEVTLEQAATVAEFEDDADTAKALVVAAVQEPGTFEHIAQRARDDRIRAAHRERLLDELKTAGVAVVKQPEYSDKIKALHRLRTDKRKELTESAHTDCPGHVAWLVPRYQDVDGRRIQLDVPEYGCRDHKKHGHIDSYATGGLGGAKPELTEDEREKAKAERRLAIDNNKAWDAAEVVRRAWLKEFAQRKTPPKGAAAFVVSALALDRDILNDGIEARGKLCVAWGLPTTKVGHYGDNKGVTVPGGTTEPRALMLLVAQVVAAHEIAADRMDWRRNGKDSRAGRYLRFLESAGYGLSDVEKFAVSSKTVG